MSVGIPQKVPPARVALIGFGFGGRVFHAPLLTITEGFELHFIVTSDAGRQAAAAAAHPRCEVLSHTDELWPRADEVDLVVISTPNVTHVSLAQRAIRLGLAVVVDKPLAPSVATGAALIAEADQLGIPLTVFQNRRWDSDFLTMQALVGTGGLGHVHRFESRFERWRPRVVNGWKESKSPEDGGGVVFDLGAHLVDQALMAFGPVVAVYAEVAALRDGAGAADDAFISLRHRCGTLSHLWMTYLAAERGPRLRVLGDHGSFTVWGMDPQEADLIAGRSPTDSGWGASSVERSATFCDGHDDSPVALLAGNYPAFYTQLERALRDGVTAVPCDPLESLTVIDVVAAAISSATTGQVVAVGTSDDASPGFSG